MNAQKVNRISGRVVLGLSLFAMSLVVGAVVLVMLGRVDPAPGADEGNPAHLFPLAIVLLMPALALGVAFSTLFYMENVRECAADDALGRLPGGASRGPALLLPQRRSVFSVVAPGPPGAAYRKTCTKASSAAH